MFNKKKNKGLNSEKINMPDNFPGENKSNTDNNTHTQVKQTDSYGYNIELYDVWDTTSKRLKPFGANRIIEDNNVYLFNPQNGFKEPFPENSDDFKAYKLEELDKSISVTTKNIDNIKKGKSDRSLKDEIKELRMLKNYKRSIELQGRGSYMILDATGKPTFMFDRVGNIKMPLFKNVDRSLIYTPTELKTKEITQLLKENEEKNGEERRVKLSTYAAAVILFLVAIAFVYFTYKTNQLPSEFVDALVAIANNYESVSQGLNSLNESVTNIASQQSPDLSINPTTNTVTGR